MQEIYQIPRNSLTWLLVALMAVVLPHADRIPVWLTFICMVCILWRVQVYRGIWSFPNKPVKLILVITGVAGIFLHYGTFVGATAGVTLLIMAFAYKLLEMYSKRDAYVVTVLAYFVLATEFLFNQSIPMALYAIFCLLVITAALIGLNQSRSHRKPWRTAKLSALILLQSVPLMVVLFILVPRIGPLWSLNLDVGGNAIGLSESMSPGDFTQLTKSTKLAFRAKFDEDIPSQDHLYWRALVLYDFDGRTWSQGDATFGNSNVNEELVYWPDKRRDRWYREYQQIFDNEMYEINHGQSDLNYYRYQITMEPSKQPWLFGLDMPNSEQRDVGVTRDFRLISSTPIKQTYRYRASSVAGLNVDKQLPAWLREKSLEIPDTGNARSRVLALKWRSEAGTDKAFVAKILTWFNQQPFMYSLQAPELGLDIVDEFFFDSQKGFCIHYAGAFSYFMRAAGIPARVIAGYMGGEENVLGNYLLVHQFDAHAWVEVWLEGEGWIRIDPTAAVAPERIQLGLEEALSREQSFLQDTVFSPLKYRTNPLINNIRFSLDYANYLWHQNVLGYDAQLQNKFLTLLLGELNPQKIAFALFGSGLFILALVSIFLFSQRSEKKLDPVTSVYLEFCKKLTRIGLHRQLGEGPRSYARRVADEKPELDAEVQNITQIFISLVYQPNAEADGGNSADKLKQFRQSVKNFSP